VVWPSLVSTGSDSEYKFSETNHCLCTPRVRDESTNEALVVHHIAHGALQIGHCQDDPTQLDQILQLWKDTKISHKVSTTDSLLRSRWLKLCWNIPFNGLAVALGGVSTDVIVTDPDLRFLADEIMQDVISLANTHLQRCSISDRLMITIYNV